MSEDSEFRKRILEEAPRFGLDDTFTFSCHPGVPCFNECCADINIVLTPYCVLRLTQRLGISSEDFHRQFTLVPFNKEIRQPVPVIKMRDDERKSCPFLGPDGCTVYEDRPWACRMYPVGLASPADDDEDQRFYFLLEEKHCKGFGEAREYSIRDWVSDQGIAEYDEAGELFKPISLHPFWDRGDLSPAKMDMFFMAAYNLGRFRRFVFESSFLEKFDVDPEVVEAMRGDDGALMEFGFRWIRFAIFEETALALKPAFDALQDREKRFFDRGGDGDRD